MRVLDLKIGQVVKVPGGQVGRIIYIELALDDRYVDKYWVDFGQVSPGGSTLAHQYRRKDLTVDDDCVE